MAERILNVARPITVELVHHWPYSLRASRYSLVETSIHIFNVQHDAHRRSAQSPRASIPHLRILVGQHDGRISDLDLSVANLPIRATHAHEFLGTKGFLVKLDGTGGILEHQIGCCGV